jgi:methyl-accepting chemotaxis protein
MKNLKVWQKLGLLGAVYLLPFAFVTWHLVQDSASSRIASASREIAGAKLYLTLPPLMRDLQAVRDLNAMDLSVDTVLKETRERLRAEAAAAFNMVSAAAALAEQSINIGTDWQVAAGSVRQALLEGAGDDQVTQAIGDLEKLILALSEQAEWNRDYDPGRSQLREILVSLGPDASEILSNVRALGLRLATVKSTEQRPPIAEFERQVRAVSQFIGHESALEKTVGNLVDRNNSTINQHIRERRQSLANSAYQVLGRLQNVLKTGQPESARTFYVEVTETLDLLHGLFEDGAMAMIASLEAEQLRTRGHLHTILALALLLVLAAAFFGWLIMRDITRPLEQLASSADVVAGGDLSVRIPFENRRDEIGVLVSAFNGMVFSLNRIVSQVQKSGIQVNTSTNQISVTSAEQQAAAREIADTTNAIGETASKISATSQDLVGMMNDAFHVAEETTGLANGGQEGLTRMRETMRELSDSASLIHTKLDVLNQKAGNINQVITTITKIADRTNLLSLNAAIEAEKAGEYGRGFSVVATEIRRLADQTAVATDEIEQMVKEMQAAVTTGVMGMNKFSEDVRQGVAEAQGVSTQLNQIIEQVQALTPRFELVNQGVQSQAGGGAQISESLSQLGRTVRQTAQSLEESNDAVEQLKSAAYDLRDGVARFKLPR